MPADAPRLPARLDFVARELPFPLAVTYGRVWAEADAGQVIPAVLQMKDAFEAALKFAAAAAVADCLRAGPPDGLAGELAADLFRPLSDGTWVDLLKKATAPVHDDPAHAARRALPALAGLVQNALGDEGPFLRVFTSTDARVGFVTWRNKELGHGAFRRDRAFYRAQLEEWLPKLNDCLTALRPVLDGWRLVGVTPGGERVDWTGDLAMDRVAPHAHEKWGEPVPLALAGPGGADLPFGPLVAMHTCAHPGCDQPAAFFFEGNEFREKQDRHRTFFLEYFVGQTRRHTNWPPVRELAARLPAKFVFERASYDHRRLAEQVGYVFRDAAAEYRRPAYLLDAFWDHRGRHPTGYYLWEAEQGVGKSFLVHGLEADGDARGVTVLRYHVLAGDAARYQTFVSELAQEVRRKLREVTQEIQTLVARQADLPAQFATFVAEVMRANGKKSLVIAVDGLDELRDPDPPTGAVLTDFLPPVGQLPKNCLVALTARPGVCGRVRDRLAALGVGERADAPRVRIDPAADPNREVVRAYLAGHGPPVLREPAAADRVLALSRGVFLYAGHFARALAAGAYATVDDLPGADRFYADYLARLRERVGDALYRDVYERALLLLAAARVPVTRAQLVRWGVPGDRLAFALRDVGDFVRELRHRAWHDGIGDDDAPRYELAHEAFARYAAEHLGEPLTAAHRVIAAVALLHNATKWEGLDPADDAELYDVRFVLAHCAAAGLAAEAATLRREEDLAAATARAAAHFQPLGRARLAEELFELAVALYRGLLDAVPVDQGLVRSLAEALCGHGVALKNVGRVSEAVAPLDEAVRRFKNLSDRQRRLFSVPGLESLLGNGGWVQLADALTSKGNALQALGRPGEALECHTEAIRIRRECLQTDRRPDTADDLARSLVNAGVTFRALGRPGDAIGCYDEAVRIRRALITEHGRTDLAGDLAGARTNMGNALQALGRSAEAVECHDEAARLLRDLIATGRDERTGALAAAVMNKGTALAALGRFGEAEGCLDEAIRIRRELVESMGRTELAGDLADTLVNRATVLVELGRLDEAADAQAEAVRLLGRLADGEERLDLAGSLAAAHMVSAAVSYHHARRAGGNSPLRTIRLSEAAGAYDRAIQIYRRRADLADRLATALAGKGAALDGLGVPWEAAECDDEAIRIRRDLVENHGRGDLAGDLGATLVARGLTLLRDDERDEAIDAFDQAIAVYGAAGGGGDLPWTLAEGLAAALMNKAVALSNAERLPEAAEAAGAAANLFRRSFTGRRLGVLPDLLYTLGVLWVVAARRADWPAAVAALVDGVVLMSAKQQLATLTVEDQREFRQLLSRVRRLSTDQHAALLAAAGEHADGIRRLLTDA